MAPRDSFPFERLPAELRVQIYELLYLCEFPLYIVRSRRRKQIAGVTYPFEHGNKSGERAAYLDKDGAALLRTKKAIHNEALPLLYARNAFIFPMTFAFREFADTAESGVALTRTVTFRMISPKFYAHPTNYLDVFTGIRSFEWTLRDLIGSRSYSSFLAKRLLKPARDFVCFGTSAVSRRARFDMIRFVTRMRVTPQQPGRPGCESVEEVLRAIQDELEKLLAKKAWLQLRCKEEEHGHNKRDYGLVYQLGPSTHEQETAQAHLPGVLQYGMERDTTSEARLTACSSAAKYLNFTSLLNVKVPSL
ncbi:hypothetical protein LTR27_007031 [Elasticomyces elasticus]|nr:hypothetical protein LTR27_007031 [Elasticomyces elasticus]